MNFITAKINVKFSTITYNSLVNKIELVFPFHNSLISLLFGQVCITRLNSMAGGVFA